MAVKMEVDLKKRTITVSEPESVSSLVNGFYGKMKKGVISLTPEEALYLLDIRNAKCYDKSGNMYKFNDIARLFKTRKQMAKYFTYKDWRDRGLIARPISEISRDYGRSPVKRYPSSRFVLDKYSITGVFYPDDLWTIIDDKAVGRDLYENYWIGQFGTYKAEQRGNLSKLDAYETLFMLRHGNLHLKNATEKEAIRLSKKQRKDFMSLYEVYEDWRLRGFILKTGFKFGTHFRVYFPKASPVRAKEEWIHSKHVIHVFPRKSKMLISEWARAIRVAHSVKKTFILAIPGKKKGKKKPQLQTGLDFLLYHRRRGGIENPKEGKPRYLMFSLSEEEYMGGAELAEGIDDCKRVGLQLMLAIADRETSVTYYRIKRIDLPGSKYEYYEIEWEQP